MDISEAYIEHLAVHRVGNPVHEQLLELSEEELSIDDDVIKELILHYFLSPFKGEEWYSFNSHEGNHEANPIWECTSQMWEEPGRFMECSKEVARQLFHSSQHANIKDGDLFVASIKGLSLEGHPCNAIGFFKCETKEDFLKLLKDESRFELRAETGINVNRLDKGCLVFDQEMEKGYRVGIWDRNGRSPDARFWTEDFLGLRAGADDYHHTQNFLSMTKEYVTEHLTNEFEVERTDQIDILNRSIEYFKENDHFDESDFGQAVFGDEEVIHSFQDFGKGYQQEHEMEIEMDFAISSPAVKKQSRVFKSVLKLDKNFHVYIHGNKDLIERGVEDDGRKFYKIYYDEER